MYKTRRTYYGRLPVGREHMLPMSALGRMWGNWREPPPVARSTYQPASTHKEQLDNKGAFVRSQLIVMTEDCSSDPIT